MTLRRVAVMWLCVTSIAVAAPPAPASDASSAAAARLHRLLDASDEALLDRNPMFALYRGDTRRAAEHGDGLSAAYVEAERRAAEAELAELALIPRDSLAARERIAYDAFRHSREESRERHSGAAAAIWPLLPIDHFDGGHLFFADLSSGEGVAPYRSVRDYDNGLSRIDGFIVWLDRVVERLREGQRKGVVLPRVVVERLIVQFDSLAEQRIEESPYYGPIRRLPADMPAHERERLARAYAVALTERLRPAWRRVHDFLVEQYLPSARISVGLYALPGGTAYYEFLLRSNTTTLLNAAQIHELGLAEVARIASAQQAVMRTLNFDGRQERFFDMLRNDPRFEFESDKALADQYAEIDRRVGTALPGLFDMLPKTVLAMRPTPAEQAATDAAARYIPGSLATGQPGMFYFNTHALKTRRLWQTETLYLHEALPGHHLQVSLAAEATDLPKLLRYGGNNAYSEGWALYAEGLGPALGLFTDPYQLFGHYNDEMLRAMRLVVDTGLHAYGWSRERAIDYMLEHSAMSRVEATAEVERYIVVPGQALAYKVGQLTLQRLRKQAELRLGDRFDIREFHRQILDTGNLPMTVLEAKIDAWIGARASR